MRGLRDRREARGGDGSTSGPVAVRVCGRVLEDPAVVRVAVRCAVGCSPRRCVRRSECPDSLGKTQDDSKAKRSEVSSAVIRSEVERRVLRTRRLEHVEVHPPVLLEQQHALLEHRDARGKREPRRVYPALVPLRIALQGAHRLAQVVADVLQLRRVRDARGERLHLGLERAQAARHAREVAVRGVRGGRVVDGVVQRVRAVAQARDEVRPGPYAGCEHEERGAEPGQGLGAAERVEDVVQEGRAEEGREDGEEEEKELLAMELGRCEDGRLVMFVMPSVQAGRLLRSGGLVEVPRYYTVVSATLCYGI